MAFFQQKGIQLHYQEWGTGEPVLLLHGLGSCIDDWQMQIQSLSGSYRVIAMDCRGHGHSDRPSGPYSIPQYASDVTALLIHLGISQVHVVGFSLGGMTAFQLAANNPEYLLSMTIINATPSTQGRTLAEKLLVWQRLAAIRLVGMKGLGRLLSKRLFPEASQRELYKAFVARMEGFPKKIYLKVFKSLLDWDVTAKLNSMSMPVLIVTADQDYTPVSLKQDYLQRLPNAQLVVIKNSRHATPLDQPQALNQVLNQFFKSLPEREAG